MGKGRDKRKKQKGSTVSGKGLNKTEKKSDKNEEKKTRRVERKLKEDGDDIETILTSLKLKDKEALALDKTTQIIEDTKSPSVRVHATYTPITFKKNNIIVVFGGEYEDIKRDLIHMYRDLYFYNCDKNTWKQIICHKSPSPRSAHQMIEYRECLYMFGGEFTSPHQEKFKHFKDFWRFDLNTNEWEDISAKQCPSKRSGHRMAVHQKKIYLFGGFYDDGDKIKYYNDMWTFDLNTNQWEDISDTSNLWPSGRSGFRMVVYENEIYIHGGYCKLKNKEDQEMEHGKVLDDTWIFHIQLKKWEKVKNTGMFPGPRSGFNWALHKKRAVYFGGATDNETKKGEAMVSEFHNDLYQLNFEKKKWYTVNLRLKKKEFEIKSSEEEVKLNKAATIIQSRYRGYSVRKAIKLHKIGGHTLEMIYSPATFGLDNTIENEIRPKGRIIPGMAIIKNTLYLFGGTVEIFDKEICLDDIWCLDLIKYDGWHCIQENTAGNNVFDEVSESSSSGYETVSDE